MDKYLKTVRAATWDMRAKWRDLGVELRINMGTLEVGFIALFPTLYVVVGTSTADSRTLVHRQSNLIATIRLETASLVYWRSG